MKLNTSYMGLQLKSPLVIASSGLTNSVDKIKELESAGAAAVVLKSIFEEQINSEVTHLLDNGSNSYPEAEDYIKQYARQNNVQSHIDLIKGAKAKVEIPIIASINCTSSSEWIAFAKDLENAGADALELNMFYVPTDKNSSSDTVEQTYINLVKKVTETVSIPVAVKVGFYYTNIIRMVEQLHANGASAVTMFNRFYEPDIDINKMEMTSSEVFSSPADIRRSLRWIGLTSAALPEVEIAASTGVHDGEAAIKQLLAGAQVVQLCSSVYLNGKEVIEEIQNDIKSFMNKWNFDEINEFRAKLSYKGKNPQMYERAQFMRYFSKN